MTREEAVSWHASLAAAAGMLSGALARKSFTRRMVQDALSLIRPVAKAMEIDELTYAAQAKAEEPPKKIQRQTRRKW